ncbi:unnamed protein product [Rotaria sordida]|uniref:Cullin N-terminal domain-containing protein n=1 Tax=Rotaria sordida TaxID=392033 RepID=A0A814NZJ5_9BILA|nr:unnamed protein product [Rotaria sordida]
MYNVAANDTSNEILIKLFHDIDRIFSYQTCDVNSVIELYTRVYNYCTSASARLAEFRLLETATGRRKYLLQATYFSYGSSNCAGGELYYYFESYLINYLENLLQMNNNISREYLLQFYTDQWNKYKFSSNLLKPIFSYLNREWVQFALKTGYNFIYETFTISCSSFV